MRVLVWHVHGGWMDAFVRGDHDYLLPTNAVRDAWGLGRAGRDWPANAIEVPLESLRDTDVDVVVLQRTEELDLAARLLGRVPGRDVPAVFVEHNTPKREPVSERHPIADQERIPIVHVTHFNRLAWDSGRAPTHVIEHGVPDPGPRYSGELEAIGAAINEPVRRRRVVGADLLPAFAAVAPVDVFGMGGDDLPDVLGVPLERLRMRGDVPPGRLHAELARRRVYVHPFRWTSLGLALLEAMHLGMPVLALATTEAIRAVPPEAGAISTDPSELVAAARRLLADPDEARARGEVARAFALERYGLERFQSDWNALITELADAGAADGSRLMTEGARR